MVDEAIDSSRIGERCPYCRTPWTMEDASQCPDCSTVSHRECWIENGGCPVMGCASAPADVVTGGGPARPWGSQHMHGQQAQNFGGAWGGHGARQMVVPVQPVQPVASVQPVVPVQPVAPVQPVQPVVPVEPVEAVESVQPIAPVEPAAPAPEPWSSDPSPVPDSGGDEQLQPVWATGDGSGPDDVADAGQEEIDVLEAVPSAMPEANAGQPWVSDQPLTVDVESDQTPWYVEAVADPASAEAGWYPDPRSLNQYRWWDGTAWTETTYPM